MRIGDNISTAGTTVLPGMPLGFNGTDFDLIRSIADNADAIAALAGGANGSSMRILSMLAGFNGATFDRLRTGADSADAQAVLTLGVLRVLAEQVMFNGSSFDRVRGNLDNITLVTLSAASASGQSADQTNFNARGVKIFTNVTAISGTSPVLVINVQIKDPVSGQYFTVLTSANITATGNNVLTVYPGVGVTANVSASDILTRTWRVSYTITGTTPSVTATIAAMLIN